MKHVLQPVEAPFSPEVAAALDRYPKAKDGSIIRLFRVFANSLRFLTKKGVLNLLDPDSPVSLRHREIVILRVTANNNCEYEWGVHVAAFARAARLTDAQVRATRMARSDAACWTREEQLLIRCVDELCRDASIEDATYERFQETWDLAQQLEILALCGNYHLVSFVANTARVELEPGTATFPAS